MHAQRLVQFSTTSIISISGATLAGVVAAAIALGAISGAVTTAAVDGWARAQVAGPAFLVPTQEFDAVAFRRSERSFPAGPTFDGVSFRAEERSTDWRPAFDAVQFRAEERGLHGGQ